MDQTVSETLPSQLRSQTTWKLVLLSIITYGVYAGHYVRGQTARFNGLPSAVDQIPTGLATSILVIAYISLGLLFPSIFLEEGNICDRIGSKIDLVWSILLIVWSFKFRNRMNRSLDSRPGEPRWFSGLWSFLFTPFYINFKLNSLCSWEKSGTMPSIGALRLRSLFITIGFVALVGAGVYAIKGEFSSGRIFGDEVAARVSARQNLGKSLENCMAIAAACQHYADAHNGDYPTDLLQLVSSEAITDATILTSPFASNPDEISYLIVYSTTDQPSPATKVPLIRDRHVNYEDRVAVGYSDGSAIALPSDKATQLGKPQNGD